MNGRKTTRKNKTNQVENWPSNENYFTISEFVNMNRHMVTSSGSDITLRVRLKKAINEKHIVEEIGSKNMNKGRPIKIFAMTPVKPEVMDKAKKDGVILESKSVPIVQVNKTTDSINSSKIPTTTLIKNIHTPSVKV